MKHVAQRSIRRVLALGLVVVAGSAFTVSGSLAASSPTFSVTCVPDYYGRAVFTWSGVSNLGLVHLYAGSSAVVQLPNPQRSGTVEVTGVAQGPAVYAAAQFFSKPDRSGQVVLLGEAYTPGDGCPSV